MLNLIYWALSPSTESIMMIALYFGLVRYTRLPDIGCGMLMIGFFLALEMIRAMLEKVLKLDRLRNASPRWARYWNIGCWIALIGFALIVLARR